MNVLMLFPKFPVQTFWNLNTVVRRICGKRCTMAPLGLLTVASYLPEDFNVRLVDRNLREETDAEWQWADVVLLSLMLVQRDDYEACLRNAARHRKPVAVGGPYTHAMPEKAAAEADWVCYGEAESVMDEFVADLRAGRRGKRYHGGRSTDMLAVRVPRYSLLESINDYYAMPIQFSRGCPFRCEFCDIIEFNGRIPRTKSPAQILAELDAIHRLDFDGCVFIVDDNFIGNRAKARRVLESIEEWNSQHKSPYFFFTEASLNLAEDPALLDAMERANFMFVFLGVETPDPVLMKAAGKFQNATADTVERLRIIREHGIHIIAGMIIGFDGEDRNVFARQLAFLDESGLGVVMLGLLQALPHTQLSRRLKREGRLLERLHLGMNVTTEGLNFIPKGEMTKREYLVSFARLIGEVFAPEGFFRRILPAHLALRRRHRPPVHLMHIKNVLRICWILGWRLRAMRRPFWRAFLAVARKNPRALGPFCYDCAHYLHLYQHKDYVQAKMAAYLADPDPSDVLDMVVPAQDRTPEDPAALPEDGAVLNGLGIAG